MERVALWKFGCGEGRVSRELKTLGFQVTATDAIAELVEAARLVDSAENYTVADAKNRPFGDGQFDLVVAYNVLMDVENVPVTVREIRRVMKPDAAPFISWCILFGIEGALSTRIRMLRLSSRERILVVNGLKAKRRAAA